MSNTRTIVVKTLLSADEFLALDSHCKQADVSHSKALRDLAKTWIAGAQRNDRRAPAKSERPGYGHNMAMFLPGKTSYGLRSGHMRL